MRDGPQKPNLAKTSVSNHDHHLKVNNPRCDRANMALLLRQQALRGTLPKELLAACILSINSRHVSVLNRPPPNYPGHVPLTRVEKAGLAVGSAVMSLMDPHRGGLLSSIGSWDRNKLTWKQI